MRPDHFEKAMAIVCFIIAMLFFVFLNWSLFWQIAFSKIGILAGFGGTALFGKWGLNLWRNNRDDLDRQMK
jgi:hypothetical protein